MAAPTANAVLDRLLDPVANCLTEAAARKLVALRADRSAQSRMDQLAGKANEGTLSEVERAEYDAYISAATMIGVLQAKARKFLSQLPAA